MMSLACKDLVILQQKSPIQKYPSRNGCRTYTMSVNENFEFCLKFIIRSGPSFINDAINIQFNDDIYYL